jgi:hypothetical protein
MTRTRRLVAVLGMSLALAGMAAPALASWAVGSSDASGSASATILFAPASPAAATVTPTNSAIDVSFSGANPSGTTYTVTRDKTTAGGAGPQVACAGLTASPCHDTGLANGITFTYAITAVLGAWTAAAATTPSATTSSIAAFQVTPASLSQVAGTSFNVTITAKLSDGTTDTGYPDGSHNLTFSGPGTSMSGQAPGFPATAPFASGVATTSITLYKAETVALAVQDGTPARNGTSSAITVSGLSRSNLYFVTSSAGTTRACPTGTLGNLGNSGSDHTVTVRVAVADAYGNLVAQSGSSRSVSIGVSGNGSVSTSPLTVNNGSAVTNGSTTLNLNTGSNKTATFTATSSALTPVTCTMSSN